MAYAYGGIFVISLALLPLYFRFIHEKQKEPWLFALFACICVVNLGYLLISVSKTVAFALFANKIAYLGQALIPMCMFMLIARLCGFVCKKSLVAALGALAFVIFAMVCTTGYLGWYYVSADLAFQNGAAYLVKEYGVLHPCNLIYVLGYFVAMLLLIGISLRKHSGSSQKLASFMLIIVLGNSGIWIVEKLIRTPFEILSISYLMSEFAFFFIYLILQDYIHIKDIPPVTENTPIIVVNALTTQEKLQIILNSLPEGTTLSARQTDILEGILDHKSRKDIALSLCVSENTVKTHTGLLYKALGVSGREEIYAKFQS